MIREDLLGGTVMDCGEVSCKWGECDKVFVIEDSVRKYHVIEEIVMKENERLEN